MFMMIRSLRPLRSIGNLLHADTRQAFSIGIVDGWRSPECLSSGMSWGDERDDVYDVGVNWGQLLRGRKRAEFLTFR